MARPDYLRIADAPDGSLVKKRTEVGVHWELKHVVAEQAVEILSSVGRLGLVSLRI
jgi:hypothetical protein